jgi:hypothetical protein
VRAAARAQDDNAVGDQRIDHPRWSQVETARSSGSQYWLDVTDADDDDIAHLTTMFDLHPEVLSDTTKFGQRSTVKSTSIFFYTTSEKRALSANSISDAMYKSESYNGPVTTVTDTVITGITYYAGEKGDEVSDYTHNTKLGVRASVKSTSIFFYGDGTKRAASADSVSDAMFRSKRE